MIKISKSSFRSTFRLIALAFLASFSPLISNHRKTNDNYYVFFDLGEVLLTTNKFKAFNQNPRIFIENFLIFNSLNSISIARRMFELITYQSQLAYGIGTATAADIAMPGLMCQAMCGQISTEQLVMQVSNIELDHPFFKNKSEARLIICALKMLLPHNLININKTTDTLSVFEQCCRHDANRVCILSNWDRSSIPLLKKQFPEIFAKIKDDQIFFSGELGCMKPDPKIYELAANKIGAEKNKCILVDDQKANIAGAKAAGWQAILHKSAKSTAKTLRKIYKFKCK